MTLEFLYTYSQWIYAILAVVTSVVAAKVFIAVFTRSALHMTSRTKTTLDDAILSAIKRPIYIGIILAGVFVATRFLDFLSPYAAATAQTFALIWILLGTYTATRLVRATLAWYAKGVASKTGETMMPIIRKLANVFIYVIAIMIMLRSFGVEITPLVAGLGVGGIAIALALQDSLSNLFSGAFMVSDKTVKTGDFVELENIKGFVEEIGWRSTKIRTLPGNLVIIPNSKLANSTITDYSAPAEEMSVVIPVGVAYSSDLEKVEKATVEVAKHVLQETEGGRKDFEPFIRYNQFADSNINFSVILRVNTFVDQYLVTHEFMKALKKRYDHDGIEISFPVRRIVK